jgi:ABC-type uncharacterized transport system permease subunit
VKASTVAGGVAGTLGGLLRECRRIERLLAWTSY